MKSWRLKTPATISAILGVIVLALLIAVVDQHIGSATRAAEIQRQKQMLSALTKEAIADQNVRRNYATLSKKVGRRYKTVSWGQQMPFMVNQLTGILTSHNLNIETLRPEPVTSANEVSRLPLRISFKAQLGDLAQAIRDIERANPLLCIEQMDLRVSGNRSDLLQANMIVSSFAISDASAPDIKELAKRSTADKPTAKESKPAMRADAQGAHKPGKSSQPSRGI